MKEIFMPCAISLIVFNALYILSNPSATFTMTIGVIIGFVATIVFIAVLSSIQIFGSGLTGEAVNIIFGVCSILNILFQVDIVGFPIGLGLGNNLLTALPIQELGSIGFVFATVFLIVTFISGLITVIGG